MEKGGMTMKTFVEPLIQTKPATKRQQKEPSAPHFADLANEEIEPLVDLSLSNYRMLMHCRGPEPEEAEREQLDDSTTSLTNKRTPLNTRGRR
jgi:hypothetical protein